MDQAVSWTYLLPTLGVFGVGLVAWLVGAHRAKDKTFLWIGAGGWASSVALKVAWAVPLNKHVRAGLLALLGGRVGEPLFWLYVGLLTGVFEVGVSLLLARRTRLRTASFSDAITFGVGFGATEAILLGVVGAIPVILMLCIPDRLPAEARTALLAGLHGPVRALGVINPVLERLSTLVIHVTSCVLVVHAVRSRQMRWFWLSFAYKSLADAAAAWAILSYGVKDSLTKMAYVEVGYVVFAGASVLLLLQIARRFENPPEPMHPREIDQALRTA